MMFKESFSFMPYKFKIGTFQYGGDDFWKQLFSEGTSGLNSLFHQCSNRVEDHLLSSENKNVNPNKIIKQLFFILKKICKFYFIKHNYTNIISIYIVKFNIK